MSKWLLRGLVFAALMVFIRLVQGAAINAWETKAGLISVTLVVLYAIAVVRLGIPRRPLGRPGQPRPRPARRLGDDLAADRPVRRARQRRGRVADLAVLQRPLRRRAHQRAHHLRGVHRAAHLPHGDRSGSRSDTGSSTGTPTTLRGSTTASPAGEDRADTDVFAAVRHPDAHPTTHADDAADETPTERRQERRDREALVQRGEVSQREQVTLHAESDDDAGGDRTQV